MGKKRRYTLLFDEEFESYLEAVEPKYLSLIRDTIEGQLSFEPDVVTRNRKPLQPPGIVGADWEIRFGPDNRFRVFYSVDKDKLEVQIIAIGVKQGNRVLLRGEEWNS